MKISSVVGYADRKGYTLLEVLVVVAIIGILAALVVPLISRSLQAAQSSRCQSNLRQWGVAMTQYLSDQKDQLMPTVGELDGGGLDIEDPEAWFNRLPTLMNMKSLKEMVDNNEAPNPVDPDDPDMSIFSCPAFSAQDLGSSPGANVPVFSYAYNAYCDAVREGDDYPEGRLPYYMIPDPTRFVIFGEVAQLEPSMTADKQVFRHRSKDRINLCFADGHVASFKITDVQVTSPTANNKGVIYNPEKPVD